MTHTDINSKGWISHLPPKIRPYMLLMRLVRPIGTWLLLLPAFGQNDGPPAGE
ncbi:MAG: 4-hydroxybenzoate polyprenyltransferase, partial [Micavibrio sp.]|nr:4-hydroxybenzoate polyprenyltransferase [Micavibrio sp.]